MGVAGTSMTDHALPSGSSAHRVPVIDRMMELLFVLEQRPDGATIRDFVESLRLPRTTVYRILNTLERHDVVTRSSQGSYRLGPRLLRLAARSIGNSQGFDLAALAKPHLESLSAEIGESSKVSVIDGDGLIVVAAALGKREYALTVVPGQRLPLHAGAAGKTLLAHLPDDEVDRRLRLTLGRYTPRTLTDPRPLRRELASIRRQGWAQDKGEFSRSIHAFAAPVLDRHGAIVAALSAPFVAGAKAERMDKIRQAVIAAAGRIAAELP
jgi:DNA-binding IclR family transcriptional regulator